MIQVFTEVDRDKLIKNGFKSLGQQQIGDIEAYIFETESMNFESISDVKYIKSNNMYF